MFRPPAEVLTLDEFDLDDTRNRPHGGSDLWRNAVSVGQTNLDLTLPAFLDDDEADLGVTALSQLR